MALKTTDAFKCAPKYDFLLGLLLVNCKQRTKFEMALTIRAGADANKTKNSA